MDRYLRQRHYPTHPRRIRFKDPTTGNRRYRTRVQRIGPLHPPLAPVASRLDRSGRGRERFTLSP